MSCGTTIRVLFSRALSHPKHSRPGCQRAKVESVKDHEVTQTHKEVANLQMNQSDMKEAVKTAILQDDHVLLNLTSIILSMAKNHDSLTSFPARCLAAEMLSVEAEGLCLFARFCSNRVGGRACCT